jgi:hypothetical protein
MFSAYYSLKSLEIFGMEGSINLANFYQFLSRLYDTDIGCFTFTGIQDLLDFNIVASSIGVELSVITGYEGYNQSIVLNFILTNKNSLGTWDSSSEPSAHELIDMFQIIGSLDAIGEITALGHDDTSQITAVLLTCYFFNGGFTPLSIDYPTMSLYHNIISSFDIFGRLSEVDMQRLYTTFSQSFYDRMDTGYCGFKEYSPEYFQFRSFPVDFYSWGNRFSTENIKMTKTHKATYNALSSLKAIFKLDDFGQQNDLRLLLDDIIGSQFLNSSYNQQHGGFLPYGTYAKFRSLHIAFIERMSKNIFFEYTYYAIKALELLVEHLNIGDITFLELDFNALTSHIEYHIIETPDILYFKPVYTENVEIILKNTFYMVEVLKIIDMYDLDTQKIKNFILTNIDYTNIKNVYYSYKLADLLELGINFDIELTQDLVQDIYSSDLHEFYCTLEMNTVEQEIFLWICEMASQDNLKVKNEFQEEAILGSQTEIIGSLSNMILSYFVYNLTFTLESVQLGTHEFKKLENNKFSLSIVIPQNPNNFPSVSGKVIVYDNGVKLTEQSIIISTVYPAKVFQDEIKGTVILSILFIALPGSVIFLSERKLKKGKFSV